MESLVTPYFPALLQVSIWELIKTSEPIPLVVMAILLILSILSWAIIFAKYSMFSGARDANRKFLRAFRKAHDMHAVAAASEQFKAAPLVAVFDFGFAEVDRQAQRSGTVTNKAALERSLQLGISEEITKLERNMNWLATTATVSPFIGLLGTVWGIIDAFQALSLGGATSIRAVGPGIAHALFATALGLFAAIPSAVAYNAFGHSLKEMGARMEDFSLEFLNLTERTFED
jgi:biopolymer transport protein TolQ